jgi:hypothetical protein
MGESDGVSQRFRPSADERNVPSFWRKLECDRAPDAAPRTRDDSCVHEPLAYNDASDSPSNDASSNPRDDARADVCSLRQALRCRHEVPILLIVQE